MVTLSRDFWTKTLVFLSGVYFVVGGVHIADDVVSNDVSPNVQAFALGTGLILTLYIFATLWSWAGKQYGYIILGLLSLFLFWGNYLHHVLEIEGRGYAGIAAGTPDVWRPLYVTGSLYAGVVTATQVIIVIYLLLKGWQSTREHAAIASSPP